MAKLNGKTALITGSTDGVGRMVAERLGADGWRILVHGRDRGRGERWSPRSSDAGGAAEFLQADLSRSPKCGGWPMRYRRRPSGSTS